MATQEPVGTLAEEAAKLISALQGWAAEHRSTNGSTAPPRGGPDPAADAATTTEPGAATDAEADAAKGPNSDAEGAEAADEYADEHQRGHHLSAECRYCPLCNVARIARAATPEVREHLTSAALSMALAVKGLLDGLERDRRGDPERERVEKIELMED